MTFLHTFLTAATEAATDAAQQPGNSTQSMLNMLDFLLLAMLFGFGVYGLYTAWKLKKEQYLFSNKILYPGNCTADTCLDPPAFIEYILPRLTILSIVLLFIGVVYALSVYVLKLDSLWFNIMTIVVPLGLLAWYAVVQHGAYKRFW